VVSENSDRQWRSEGIPFALGQETFLRSCQQKNTEFEMKIGSNVRKKQKLNIYYNYFVLFLGE